MSITSYSSRFMHQLLALSTLTVGLSTLAQNAGDYRSAASGNWNATTTWETYDGANWNPAAATPTAGNAGVITIMSPHSVTNSASATADQVVIASGATLVATATLTIADGTGTDLDIYGTFLGLGGTCLSINASALAVAESGGVMIHNGTSSSFVTINGTLQFANGGKFTLVRAGGRIPLSTWDTGSVCEVAYTADGTKPDTAFLLQNFADFTVNCPLQTSGWDFAGKLTNHVGNFTITMGANPGLTELKLYSGSGNTGNLQIAGNLTVNSGMLNIGSSGGPWVITLTSNLTVAAGADLNVSGSSTLSYSMILNGTGIQNYTINGTNRATKLNWTVNNGSILNLNSDLPVSTAGRTLTVNGMVNVNGKTVLADLLTGTGTIRNEGGGSGMLVLGTGNGNNTLGSSPALINGASGTLKLAKAGSGSLTITSPQNFTGGMIVSNGAVLVNNTSGSGSGSGTVTVYGGALGGDGIVSGIVSVETSGTLSPGSSVGKLTINNTLNLAGNTLIEVDQANATNDNVVVTTVNYGGTLTATNLGGTLNAGNSFTIFNAGSHTGNFTSIVGSPGPNLAWAFNPTNGVLSVVAASVNPPTLLYSPSGNTLNFSWIETGFKLQSQTNSLTTGLDTNWSDVPGGNISPVNLSVDPANGAVFFRLAPQ